ncbi:SBBP repeat-containing protein [Rossellomorea sp. NPDC077527]|uniref:DUF7948 domain-containing protein n=1 Tax=Rossellomorea sp. NPDC077527 TaxID=3364510 RepID=UPI0037C7FEC3
MKSNPIQSQTDFFEKTPLYFIPNSGQWSNNNIYYYAKDADCEIFFTDKGVSFVFIDAEKKNQINNDNVPNKYKGVRLDFHFLNENNPVIPIGRTELSGKINFYQGSDSKNWHTNITPYGEVVYNNVWEGIDLHFHGKEGKFKYEFLVQPRCKVEDIQFTYKGFENLFVDNEGNLRIQTHIGEVVDKRPLSFQGKGKELKQIDTKFKLSDYNLQIISLGFTLEDNYDPHIPLLIDPGLVFSSYLGGAGGEDGYSISTDSTGNAYVTGQTNSLDFPTLNAFQPIYGGNTDAFITKVDPAGNLIYSSYLGGNGGDSGDRIVTDNLGNAYITGFTNSTDFPIQNAFQPTFGGNGDCFVTKLSPLGSLIYSSYLGGSGGEFGLSISIDSTGNAYVTGETGSLDFPTQNAFQSTFGGFIDAFVTKINPIGDLIYSSYLGGTQSEFGGSILTDSIGNAYIYGVTESTNFPTQNAFQSTFGGVSDVFITKVGPTGSLIYSTYLGGTDFEFGESIDIDSIGNAYITGYTASSDFPTQNAFQSTYGGNIDAFVTKLNPTGDLIFSTYLGGTDAENGYRIITDSTGNAYITGYTASSDFPTQNAFQPTFGGGNDAFVTKVSSMGGLIYSSFLGGTDGEFGNSISSDSTGNAYIMGTTNSINFPTQNAFQPNYGGNGDIFVTKVNPTGGLIYSSYLGGAEYEFGYQIITDSNGNGLVTGYTQSQNFPTQNAFQPNLEGSRDAFITKIGLICPKDITVVNSPGECGAIIEYNSSPGAVCTPPSGSFFEVGKTIVECLEGDQSCSFTVTVIDTEPPTIICPDDIEQDNDPDECGASVTYPAPTITDNCPGVTFTCTPSSGSFFPVGTTPVTCVATDASGNRSEPCTFNVTVIDTEPPVIKCSDSILIFVSPSESGTVVTYPAPTVSDNCPGVTFSCLPPSGSFFHKGSTMVTCTATDHAGNKSSCFFEVIVKDSQMNSTECINVMKVFDWLFYSNKYKQMSIIPYAIYQPSLSNALSLDGSVIVKCIPPALDQIQYQIYIIQYGNPGKVLINWTIPVKVSIQFQDDLTFSYTVQTQVQDEVMACIPHIITEENIICRAHKILCQTDEVSMNSVPSGSIIQFTTILCKEIDITYPMNLKVPGTICFPRSNNIL